MTTRWFLSTDPWDPAWHRWLAGEWAVCGAVAHRGFPWLDTPPRNGIICADCED